MNRHARLLAAIPFAASMLWPAAAYSKDTVLQFGAPSHIYTQSEVANARPLVNPLAAPDTSNLKALALPTDLAPGSSGASAIQPNAFGPFRIPYTSTRVQQGASNKTSVNASFGYLASTFPYRAIGKLLFNTVDGPTHCSASVIRTGIIVTAAHCIQDFGTGATTFTNFQFIPGHDGRAGFTVAQQRPYGIWSARAIVRPLVWQNGTDRGCDAARNNDLAILALNQNAAGDLIGDVVGKLNYGWNNVTFVSSVRTGNLATGATSTLGFPGLLDAGRIMQRTDGPSYLTTVTCPGNSALNIWQGNGFTGGSSGGPWIVNFLSFNPVLSGGAVLGGQSGANTVIGVTSWGSADPNANKDNYSSRFGQNPAYPAAAYDTPTRGAGNIAALLTQLCNAPAGAPFAGSYEANGWCN